MEAVNIIWWCALYLHLLAGGSLTAANTRWKRQDLLYPSENTQSKANGISECLTHKNTKGSCRDVTMCEVLQAEIQRGLHPNICEWKGIIPIVCCPLSPTVTPVTTITTQSPVNDRGCARVPVTISPAEFRREEAKGNPAKAGSWPWMAAIFMEKSGKKQFLCGGSLIDHQFVLSAARCFSGIVNPKLYTVRLGVLTLNEDNRGSTPQDFQVRAVRVHAYYIEGMNYNDIALLYLEKPANYSKFIQPACLPAEEVVGKNLTGKNVIVTGWGHEFDGTETSVLREGEIQVFSNTECEKAYENSRNYENMLPQGFTDVLLCAGTLGKEGVNACQGDSGGPLLLATNDGYWTLVGILSFRAPCADSSFPGVYTRVSTFLEWIYLSVNVITFG